MNDKLPPLYTIDELESKLYFLREGGTYALHVPNAIYCLLNEIVDLRLAINVLENLNDER